MIKKNVVLVEDSSFIRSLLRHNFVEKGFEVYEAESGDKLLRSKKFNPAFADSGLLDKVKVDLFIIDVELEDISGVDVVKKLRSHIDFKNIPIIINSSHNDKDTIINAISSGANDYVLKKDNFVNILLEKSIKLLKGTLDTFETTLEHELEWVKYGGKEISLAFVAFKPKKEVDKDALEEFSGKVMEKLRAKMRHYDWLFSLEDRTIAVILPLTTLPDVVVLRRRLLEQLRALEEELRFPIDVQIGFSHYPNNAKNINELISLAKGGLK